MEKQTEQKQLVDISGQGGKYWQVRDQFGCHASILEAEKGYRTGFEVYFPHFEMGFFFEDFCAAEKFALENA